MDQSIINSLIALLDDPDREVYKSISRKIISYGDDAIPTLEQLFASDSQLVALRAAEIVDKIQFEKVATLAHKWIEKGDDNLLQATLFFNQLFIPDFDKKKVISTIDSLKRSIWLKLNDDMTAIDKVKVLNNVLFNEQKYCVIKSFGKIPQSHQLSYIIDQKKGSPMAIMLLYLITAQESGISIYGGNVPGTNISCYVDNDGNGEILFYINPSLSGTMLPQIEISHFLESLNIESTQECYVACTNKDTIINLLNLAALAYIQNGNNTLANHCEELIQILNNG
ncbi:MAG: transglutaminase-like domain-containing protein [Salinivirgaceae bacterium]|nr:transglutaminase-like domain-containing protein [Salinivirgaceae bacterium]